MTSESKGEHKGEKIVGKPAWLDKIVSIFSKKKKEETSVEEEDNVCCEGLVHIAYRGVSDDRLYLAEGRKWGDVRFFKPRGLRVYCAGCRRRLL